MTELKFKVGDKVIVNQKGVDDDEKWGFETPTGELTVSKIYQDDDDAYPYAITNGAVSSEYTEAMLEPVDSADSGLDAHTVKVISDYFLEQLDNGATPEELILGFAGYLDGLIEALGINEDAA